MSQVFLSLNFSGQSGGLRAKRRAQKKSLSSSEFEPFLGKPSTESSLNPISTQILQKIIRTINVFVVETNLAMLILKLLFIVFLWFPDFLELFI